MNVSEHLGTYLFMVDLLFILSFLFERIMKNLHMHSIARKVHDLFSLRLSRNLISSEYAR